jgi:hypothetical protein
LRSKLADADEQFAACPPVAGGDMGFCAPANPAGSAGLSRRRLADLLSSAICAAKPIYFMERLDYSFDGSHTFWHLNSGRTQA